MHLSSARRRRAFVVLAASALSAPFVSPVDAAASPLSTRHYVTVALTDNRPTWTALALGDSVPAGTFCRCIPFPDLYARDVSAVAHRAVISVNFAVSGLTSKQLLQQLNDPNVAAAVARSSVVSVTIGANDFNYSSSASCVALRCYRPALDQLATNMRTLLARIGQLRDGRTTAVRVVSYWEIWKDGQVGAAFGATYMSVNTRLTAQVNAVLKAAATRASVAYIDLVQPFRGADGDSDDTNLLAADGDHPNAAGHARIAQALIAAGLGEIDPDPVDAPRGSTLA